MNAIMTIETMGQPVMALDIPKGQTFDEWVEMGRNLAEGQRVVQWWIGDWWNAGERNYGEAKAKAAALDVFGKEFDTIRRYAYVAARFESGERSPDLTFDHHLRAAPLVHVERGDDGKVVVVDSQSAKAVLARAEAEGLSTREVRVEVMKLRVAGGHFPTRDTFDDDPEHTDLVAIARAWNRACKPARESFLELAEEANLGLIDP